MPSPGKKNAEAMRSQPQPPAVETAPVKSCEPESESKIEISEHLFHFQANRSPDDFE